MAHKTRRRMLRNKKKLKRCVSCGAVNLTKFEHCPKCKFWWLQ